MFKNADKNVCGKISCLVRVVFMKNLEGKLLEILELKLFNKEGIV